MPAANQKHFTTALQAVLQGVLPDIRRKAIEAYKANKSSAVH